MPPKTGNAKATGPSKTELDAINAYLSQKPDFESLLKEAPANSQPTTKPEETEYERRLRHAISTTVTKQQGNNA